MVPRRRGNNPRLVEGSHNTAENQRVHIYFNHQGYHPFPPFGPGKQQVDRVLASIWSAFGLFTASFYHAEYSFCFLTFSTHAEAEAAIRELQDDAKVQSVIRELVNRQTSDASKAVVTQITDSIFVHRPGGFPHLVTPSMAAPRR